LYTGENKFMPLCTLELGEYQYQHLTDRGGTALIEQVCAAALDRTIRGLSIPDPEDREYRVLRASSTGAPAMTISFTAGADDYGTGEIFEVTKSVMRRTAREIQEAAGLSDLRVSRTGLEAWYDSAFRIANGNEMSLSTPDAAPSLKSLRDYHKLDMLIVLSPYYKNWLPARFAKMGDDLTTLIRETLVLPAQIRSRLAIVTAAMAETDLSVEMNLPTTTKRQPIPRDEFSYTAMLVEQYINNEGFASDQSATVWLKQGSPAKHVTIVD
jgi:hypothetical protein